MDMVATQIWWNEGQRFVFCFFQIVGPAGWSASHWWIQTYSNDVPRWSSRWCSGRFFFLFYEIHWNPEFGRFSPVPILFLAHRSSTWPQGFNPRCKCRALSTGKKGEGPPRKRWPFLGQGLKFFTGEFGKCAMSQVCFVVQICENVLVIWHAQGALQLWICGWFTSESMIGWGQFDC